MTKLFVNTQKSEFVYKFINISKKKYLKNT